MTNQSHLTRTLSGPEFIGLMAALMALNSLAIDVMLPALPAMGEALGVVSDNERQLVISAYMVGFGIAQLFFGPITDRFGRRSPLFVGMVIYIICAFAATFAPTFALLLAVRFAQGVGAAATRVIAMSVIRDRYSGRQMASIMSLTFMVFMALPILAPGIGQVILFVGTWHYIFLFMTGLAIVIMVWAFFRMPETLHPEYRRELKLSVITDGFRLVFSNRLAIFYGIAGMFFFGSNMGFIISSQQIFVGIYKFGDWFPVAFAAVASLMAVANFVNSRIVKQYGQRRVSHSATLVYIACGAVLLGLSLLGPVDFWAFFAILAESLGGELGGLPPTVEKELLIPLRNHMRGGALCGSDDHQDSRFLAGCLVAEDLGNKVYLAGFTKREHAGLRAAEDDVVSTNRERRVSFRASVLPQTEKVFFQWDPLQWGTRSLVSYRHLEVVDGDIGSDVAEKGFAYNHHPLVVRV